MITFQRGHVLTSPEGIAPRCTLQLLEAGGWQPLEWLTGDQSAAGASWHPEQVSLHMRALIQEACTATLHYSGTLCADKSAFLLQEQPCLHPWLQSLHSQAVFN